MGAGENKLSKDVRGVTGLTASEVPVPSGESKSR